MASLSDLQAGLVKADEAGNSDDAKVFADAIRAHPDNQPGTSLPKAVDYTKMTPVDSSPLYRDTWQLAKNVGGGLASSVAEGLANYGPMSLPSYLRDVVRGNMPGTENKPIVEAAGKIGPAMGGDPESTSYKMAKGALPMLGTAVATGGIGTAIESAMPSFLGRAAPAVSDIIANAGVAGTESAGESASQGKPISEVVKDFLKGSAYGAGGAATARVASKGARAYGNAITEPMTPEAQLLRSKGIYVTPGQAWPGGATAAGENTMKFFPGYGAAVEQAQTRTGNEYIGHYANDVMSHIGGKAEGTGLQLSKGMDDQFNTAYRAIEPQISLEVGRGNVAVQQAKRDIQNQDFLNPEQTMLVNRYIDRNIKSQLDKTGTRGARMSGEDARRIDSQIGDQARAYINDPQTKAMGEALFAVQKRWQNMYDGTPEALAQLKEINTGYRKFLPFKDATEGSIRQGGTPSTADLRDAMKRYDVKPDALSDAAVTVQPNKSRESSRRWASTAATIAGGVGGMGAGPVGALAGTAGTMLGIGGANLAGRAMSSRPVVNTFMGLASLPGGIRRQIEKLPLQDQMRALDALSPATQAGRIIGQQQENRNAP